jgi:signal transduction histidine kinase
MADETGLILVVDDNRMNRLKLSISLEQQGHKIELAEDGQQALAMLQQSRYDVVLLDILMPEMDGFQVLERMKADPTLRDIPVIVISAVDEIDSVVRCIEMGAEDYLAKPFNPVLLRARLNASLGRKKLRDLEKAYLEQEVMLRQSEKLATLGKLSAGMAHELNNPAAAALRGASQVQAAFSQFQVTQQAIGCLQLRDLQKERLLQLDSLARRQAKATSELSSMARSELENQLETWLELYNLENAWEIAPALVSLGYSTAKLDELTNEFDREQIGVVMDWLAGSYAIYSLLEEIGQGAGRISEIVKALKSYSYMDQAPIQSVDIHEGLDNTLVMLRSKLKQGITVHREYAADLPHVEAYGSELNQVWTNLVDNAVDAMNGNGELTLRTHANGNWVVVEVEDNGPGIPAAIQSKVFDPFFTTKPVGKGTGLGLNISHNIIVNKHKGQISVASQPGKTRFEVRLPLSNE